MIIWKGTETFEDKAEYDHVGRRGWRWIIEISKWERGLGASAGVYQQIIFLDKDAKWRHGASYFDISVTPHFIWGSRHDYYDGPHCSFSIGWIHFNWSYWWCTKCMPDDENA